MSLCSLYALFTRLVLYDQRASSKGTSTANWDLPSSSLSIHTKCIYLPIPQKSLNIQWAHCEKNLNEIASEKRPSTLEFLFKHSREQSVLPGVRNIMAKMFCLPLIFLSFEVQYSRAVETEAEEEGDYVKIMR